MTPAPSPQTSLPTGKTCLGPGKADPKSLSLLTKRDLALMRDLSELRFATAKDLVLMHFSARSLTYCRSLLSRLTDERYLSRVAPPRITSGNPEQVYILAEKGARALADITGIPVSWYYKPSKKGVSFSYLRHALLVTRIVAALTYFTRTNPRYTLTDCRLFYELARMRMPPTGEDNKKPQPLPVVADAWAYLEDADGEDAALWIEADCGTIYREKYWAYLKARTTFLRSGDYARVFGTPAVLMCFITTGHIEAYKNERRRALQAWTQEVLTACGLEDWAAVFRFAAVGYTELFTLPLFDAPVWYRPDDPQTPHSLLTDEQDQRKERAP
jgi:Replication-relaxation